jgi:hypothetical protein
LSGQRIEQLPLLDAADSRPSSIRDMVASPGDELTRVGLFNVDGLNSASAGLANSFDQTSISVPVHRPSPTNDTRSSQIETTASR